MEIATLVYNKKIDYDAALKTYSMYEYLKNQGNRVEIIDYDFYRDKDDKKNQIIYDFLSNNTIMTMNRYKNVDQLEENIPLADRYIVVNGESKDLEVKLKGNDNIAYGIKDLSLEELNYIKKDYSKLSTSFNMNSNEVTRVIDPMFLLTKDEWSNIADKNRVKNFSSDYILLYSTTASKQMIKYASRLAKSKDKKLFILADKVEKLLFKGSRIKNIKPFSLVSLISDASYVVTDCNDGIKLGTLFEKNLHIFTDRKEEQLGIIKDLSLESRVVTDYKMLLDDYQNFDYSNGVLEGLRLNSYNFLK